MPFTQEELGNLSSLMSWGESFRQRPETPGLQQASNALGLALKPLMVPAEATTYAGNKLGYETGMLPRDVSWDWSALGNPWDTAVRGDKGQTLNYGEALAYQSPRIARAAQGGEAYKIPFTEDTYWRFNPTQMALNASTVFSDPLIVAGLEKGISSGVDSAINAGRRYLSTPFRTIDELGPAFARGINVPGEMPALGRMRRMPFDTGDVATIPNAIEDKAAIAARTMGPADEPFSGMLRQSGPTQKVMGPIPEEVDLGLGMNPVREPLPEIPLSQIQAGIKQQSLATKALETTGSASSEAMTAVKQAEDVAAAAPTLVTPKTTLTIEDIQAQIDKRIRSVPADRREEVAADALADAYTASEKAAAEGHPNPMAYTIQSIKNSIRKSMNAVNKSKKTLKPADEMAELSADVPMPDEIVESVERSAAVKTGLAAVKEKFPLLKRLYDEFDGNVSAMARATGKTQQAMQNRVDGLLRQARTVMPKDLSVGEVLANDKAMRVHEVYGLGKPTQVDTSGPDLIATYANGAKVRIRQGESAVAGTEKALGPGQVVRGSMEILDAEGRAVYGSDAMMRLRKGEGLTTAGHEIFHLATKKQLGLLTEAEEASILAKNGGDMEKAAEYVGTWLHNRFAGTYTLAKDSALEKVYKFLLDVYEKFMGPTASGSLRRLESGEVFGREVKGMTPYSKVKPGMNDLESFRKLHTGGIDFGLMGRRTQESMLRITDKMMPKPVVDYSIGEVLPDSLKAGIESKHVEGIAPEGMITKAYKTITNAAKVAREEGLSNAWDKYMAPLLTTSTGNIEKQSFMPIVNRLVEQGILKPSQLLNDAGTKLRLLPGMLARFGSVVEGKAALKVGGEVIMQRTNLYDKILKPIRDSGANADETLSLVDQYLVARRAVGEVTDMKMARETWMKAKAQADNAEALLKRGDFKDATEAARLAKAAKAVPQSASFNKLKRFGFDGTQATLDSAISKWSDSLTGAAKAAGGDFEKMGDAAYHLQQLKDIDGLANVKVIKKVAQAVDDVAAVAVKYARKEGLITAEAYALAKAKGDYYTPLQRVFADDEFIGPNRGQAGGILKFFEGSERQIKNPATSAIDQLNMIMSRADKNEVWQMAVKDLYGMEMEAKAARLEKNIDLADRLDRMVAEHAQDVERVADAANGDPAVRKVFIDGEATFWRFKDQLAAEQMAQIDQFENTTAIQKVLKVPGLVLRRSLSLSPRYSVFNFVRDSFARVIGSKHGGSLFDAFHKWSDAEWATFIESGALQGSRLTDVENVYKTNLMSYMKDLRTAPKTIIARADNASTVIGNMFGRLEKLTTNLELQNRMAEFQNAYKHAKSVWPAAKEEELLAYAAKASRDLLDFSEAGTWIKKINQYIPLINAGIQGTRFMLKSAASNPARFAAQLGKYIAAPAVGCYALAMASGRGEEYQNLPAYRRDTFWNIALPGGYWLTIPKPFEAGVFGTGVERLVDLAGGNRRAFEGYAGSLASAMTPIGSGTLLGPLKPIVEALTNKNMFTGDYIVPPQEEGQALALRRGAEKSSRIGKTMAWMFNGVTGYESDPRQFEHVINSLFGDYGRMGTVANEPGKIASKLTGLVRKDSPYTYNVVQRDFKQYQRYGMERDKGRRSLVELLAKAQAGEATPGQVFSLAHKEEERLEKITIQDILAKRKKK